jgi:tRNA(adenine34) deaminase
VSITATDEAWMQHAFELATCAAAEGEVPVGAVLVKNNELVAEAWNQPINLSDPCAHAEVSVLRKGAQQLDNYRLLDTTLYVTLEPCTMCVGAIVHARVKRLVFGAYDKKSGAVSSVMQLLDHKAFNHRVEWCGGVLAEPCGKILTDFFQARR